MALVVLYVVHKQKIHSARVRGHKPGGRIWNGSRIGSRYGASAGRRGTSTSSSSSPCSSRGWRSCRCARSTGAGRFSTRRLRYGRRQRRWSSRQPRPHSCSLRSGGASWSSHEGWKKVWNGSASVAGRKAVRKAARRAGRRPLPRLTGDGRHGTSAASRPRSGANPSRSRLRNTRGSPAALPTPAGSPPRPRATPRSSPRASRGGAPLRCAFPDPLPCTCRKPSAPRRLPP